MMIKENLTTFLFLFLPHLQFFFSRLAPLLRNLLFYSFGAASSLLSIFTKATGIDLQMCFVHSKLNRQWWRRHAGVLSLQPPTP